MWTALLDVLILLLAAMLLGVICERLKQSAILGYLIAGTLLGPNALNLMRSHETVATIAELGVALLLFTIGLEFSWRRLRALGPIALGGGTLQIVLTGFFVGVVCVALGVAPRESIAIAAIIALSSTACVMRLLVGRAEMDSVHGRNAIGILLLQDIAVVPLVLIVGAIGGEQSGGVGAIAWELARALGFGVVLVGGLYLLLNHVLPRLLAAAHAARNRDLPIILAVVTALGAAWASHELGLSPALGAFVAGLLLAESPFSTQIRADVSPLRTLFMTLFFSSIGMLGNLGWIAEHWVLVATVVVAVMVGKTVVIAGVARILRASPGHAVATGICLAQIGEFSVVLAEVAHNEKVISEHVFELMVAATIGTLFFTPYLVALAPRLAKQVGRLASAEPRTLTPGDEYADQPATPFRDHIVMVGFGPAGQRAADVLMPAYKARMVVVEMSAKSADVSRTYGLPTIIGDATRAEVLEHLHIDQAKAVVITVPDPAAARHVIEQVRAMAPRVSVFARARYHLYLWELMVAGADVVIDEEEQVGLRLAAAVRKQLRTFESDGEEGDGRKGNQRDDAQREGEAPAEPS